MRKYLFEVSWEVCNKVGGIHTVISSKAAAAAADFGDGYYLLGPLLDDNSDFEPSDEPELEPVRRALEGRGLGFRLGRTRGPERVRVILVGHEDRFDVDELLYGYWSAFGVDSMAGGWDYVEPVLFSTACGEAIEAICSSIVEEQDSAVAHFHEWMCGGGLLHLKKNVPEIGTVFTTHATILGRSMAGAGRDIYREAARIRTDEEAVAHGVAAKHSMEVASAREADCFTTVSEVTADEAETILGRRPEIVVYNGFDSSALGGFEAVRERSAGTRGELLSLAGRLVGRELAAETRLWITSGRYELHNKGYDLFLESLAELDRRLRDEQDAPPVLAWFLMATGNRGVDDEVRRRASAAGGPSGPPVIATHRPHDERGDPVLTSCERLGLTNAADNRVLVLLTPAYLDGEDGVLDRDYYDVLAAADLGVFPSFYEPWGYTPLESIAVGVPAVTTDLAGSGRWATRLDVDRGRGMTVIERAGRSDEAVTGELTELLHEWVRAGGAELARARERARAVAERATWSSFFEGYRDAYSLATTRAARRGDSLDTSAFSDELFISFKGAEGPGPHYRTITVVTSLPEPIEGLEEIAYNLWWSWHPEALELFEEIDPELWESTAHNPVALLARVPPERLEQRAGDNAFVKRCKRVHTALKRYLGSAPEPESDEALCAARPVAYFSMEFCLHECLPIYSGGLGVLSGDHLKSASDLGIPLVAVGLLYRQGYFEQRLDRDGEQLERYPFLDTSNLPIRPLRDEAGEERRIEVELAGRRVRARIWKVAVGRVELYLLDPDVDENEPRERRIAWRLYGGERRTRIEQEVLLGVGGVSLLEDVLGLRPGVYHLNEGHCAFLLFERVRRLMGSRGLSFPEAREAAKASTVFTTHTPVPAGNETFSPELVEEYLGSLARELEVPLDRLAETGRSRGGDARRDFSMTVLALKLSSRANAVSKLHGEVCREMWRDVWKDVAVEETPIGSITNGVHLTSWIGLPMRRLLGQYLDLRWDENHDDEDAWSQVREVPDERLWVEHTAQKRALFEQVERRVVDDYARRGEDPQLIRETVERLSPRKLTVGFARRFATYKRAYLLFSDRERLARLVNHPERPVQFLLAGKAHPADRLGKELIREVVEASRDPELYGRVIYLENYDMALGRLMTQGADVWLNTPLRPHEASGTSGMKVVPNGGVNCSILDGWWDEAYDEGLGFAIEADATFSSREQRDEADALALFDLLERKIAPLYYDAGDDGVPGGWLRVVKRGLAELAPRFNTMRMVRQYNAEMYLPAARRTVELRADDYEGLRSLAAWKRKIAGRFTTVQIARARVEGGSGDVLPSDATLELEMLVRLGRLAPEELQAELVVGPAEGDSFSEPPRVVPFELVGIEDGGATAHFELRHRIGCSGVFRYALRVVPVHPLLASTQETGLAQWW